MDDGRFQLVLLHNNIDTRFHLLVKYRDQHVLEVSMVVLAKTESNLLVRIRVERAAADVHVEPMSEYLPNGIFILHILCLDDIHYLHADLSLSHFLS